MSKKCAKIGENVTNSRSLNVKEGGAGWGLAMTVSECYMSQLQTLLKPEI